MPTKTEHSKEAWKNTRNRLGLLSNPDKRYNQASPEQIDRGKSRRRLEDLKDQKDLESYVKDIWDE